MKIDISVTWATAEAVSSVRQVEAAFQSVLGRLAADEAPFASMDRLCISTPICHPISNQDWTRGRGTYSAKHRRCHVAAQIDYGAWVAADWAGRADEYARVLIKAVGTTPRTRLNEAERERLNGLIEQARRSIREAPPPELVPVESIFITPSNQPGRAYESISFQKPLHPAGFKEVPPEQATEMRSAERPAQVSTVVKLYQRVDGTLHYYEAWSKDRLVTEHWGVCGERGESRVHEIPTITAALEMLARLKREAGKRGYRTIPISRHKSLVVEIPIEHFGNDADLARRHALEEFLDEATGMLGLGHCDGGSTGSGTMEAFCLVVDFDIAKKALSDLLANSDFADYSRIYSME